MGGYPMGLHLSPPCYLPPCRRFLNHSFRQQPLFPIHHFPHDNGMLYTTFEQQATNSYLCFISHICSLTSRTTRTLQPPWHREYNVYIWSCKDCLKPKGHIMNVRNNHILHPVLLLFLPPTGLPKWFAEDTSVISANKAVGYPADHCDICQCISMFQSMQHVGKHKDALTREIIEVLEISKSEEEYVAKPSVLLSKKDKTSE